MTYLATGSSAILGEVAHCRLCLEFWVVGLFLVEAMRKNGSVEVSFGGKSLDETWRSTILAE